MRILITGGGGAGSEALWRLLHNVYELHFGDADPCAIDPIIPRDRCHRLPWAVDPLLAPKIAELCARLKIDILISTVDEELLALTEAAADLLPTQLMLPNNAYVATMLDKYRMVEALSAHGLTIPKTRLLSSGEFDFDFPCIVKPRQGRGSRGVRTIEQKEAIELFNSLGQEADKYILQQKAEGVEYTVQMVANQNCDLAAVVPVRVELKKGVTIRAEVIENANVLAACRGIHDCLPASGSYNIQLILDSSGAVFPFEINPRPSTTFCMSIAAGIDPISVFCGRVNADKVPDIKFGTKLHRHWTNHFS